MKTLGIVVVLILLIGGWYWYSNMQAPAPANSDTASSTQETSSTGGTTGGASSGTATPGNPVSDGSGHYIYTVTYNNGAFSPAVLTINHGDSIKWVNKDNLAMRVSASLQGTNPTPITDPNSQKTNGSFTLSFQQVGMWNIKNLNDTAVGPGASTVYVK